MITTQQILLLAIPALFALMNAIIMAKYNQALKRDEARNEEVVQLKKDVAILQRGFITEDKLRVVIKEELRNAFQDYELKLINEGRLDPKNRRKDDYPSKR